MSWLRNLFGIPRERVRGRPAPTPDHLHEEALHRVRRGFETEAEIVDHVVDVECDDWPDGDPEIIRSEVSAAVAAAIAVHRQEQATWPTVTDCDRLDAAFAALEAEGIVSRQDFTCCGSCGVAEIGAEIHRVSDTGGRPIGYTFYHNQDTDSAVEGHGLYLYYGAARGSRIDHATIAEEVIRQLKEHGLSPTWDGNLGKRIHVPLDWKRRLPS